MKKTFKRRRHTRPKINKKIKYVQNGFLIRNINPDFDLIHWRDENDPNPPNYVIPPDQIWIDARYRDETAFLIKLYIAEQQYAAENGVNYSAKKFREKIKKYLTWSGPKPKLTDFTVKIRRKKNFIIRFVDGAIVRQWIDPWFSFGGHSLVYDYIPNNEIWIDNKQDPREVKYTIIHEIRERWHMSRNVSYDKAHELATQYEWSLRIQELTKRKKTKKRLRIKHHWQERNGSCAQASAKMLLSYFGKVWSESSLRKITGFNKDGTDKYLLIQGIRKTGATVSVKQNATVKDLNRFLNEEKIPVLVGWWSMTPNDEHFNQNWDLETRKKRDCGHFSLIIGINDKYVSILDPDNYLKEININSGIRRMLIEDFLQIWYDTDGQYYEPENKWMLVINFRSKNYNGMDNYHPTGHPKNHDIKENNT